MKAIKDLSLPTLQIPGYPTAKDEETAVDPRDAFLWQQDIATIKNQIVQLEENGKREYVLVIGKCSPNLESKLKRSGLFEKADKKQDVIKLLLINRGFCCHFDNSQQLMWALKQAKHHVSMYYQAHDVTNTEYVEHFKSLARVVRYAQRCVQS